MRVLKRIVRLIWGDDVEPEIRPLLYVGLAGSLSASSMWTFMGIWAIDELDASSSALGVALLVGACLAAATGYVAGHLSDRLGRRPLILAGWAILSLYVLLYALVGERTTLGLIVLAGTGIAGSIGWAATQAFVADLVPRERHESAFASLRVANNLGVVGGPVLGGVLLLVSWTALFLGVSLLSAAVFALAWRVLPRRGAYAPDKQPERGSFAVIRRDHVFALFLLSTALAYIVYVAYETVLPISLVDTHGLAPSTWGFLVILNPAMVTLFQLRLTRWTAGVPPLPKLATAILLMGLPFLVLSGSAAVPVVLAVIFVFVVGEMLWVPPRRRSRRVSPRPTCAGRISAPSRAWAPSASRWRRSPACSFATRPATRRCGASSPSCRSSAPSSERSRCALRTRTASPHRPASGRGRRQSPPTPLPMFRWNAR